VTPEAAARWERERARGRNHFVWRRGVVGWGAPAALMTIAYKLWQLHVAGATLALTPQVRDMLVLIVVAFPLFGYALGRWLWTREEAEYAQHLRGRHAER
jgi:hypothetical protein